MNILKLYHARWKQDVYDDLGQLFKDRIIEYFVLYERLNHIIHQQVVNTNGINTVIGHVDHIDNLIVNAIDNKLNQIPNISDFSSEVLEFRLWFEFNQIERAWASKRAIGYPFIELKIQTLSQVIVSLKTRIRFTDAKTVKNSIAPNMPREIRLNVNVQIPTLIQADFYSPDETDRIIEDYWSERETCIFDNRE